MKSDRWGDIWTFSRAALKWTGSLLLAVALYRGLAAPQDAVARSLTGAVGGVPRNLAMLLPLMSLAGGIAVSASGRARRVLPAALGLCVVSAVVGAYLDPMTSYSVSERAAQAEALYPYGAWTPGGIRAHRDAILDDPPDEYTFADQRALPPNWLTYQLYSLFTDPLFAVPGAFLGFLIGLTTSGLSPPARRNGRWGAALACVLPYLGCQAAAAAWLMASPERSAAVAVLIPYVIVAAEVGVFAMIVWSKRGLHGSTASGVH